MREAVVAAFKDIQNAICLGLENEDGLAKFQSDLWARPGGGGGDTRVIQDGAVFEKGGVNFSEVFGELPQAMANEFQVKSREFFATGVSIVIHPKSPMVPIVHMNIRYFEMPEEGLAWFGGGIDLTPIYVNEQQGKQFHQTLKSVCDKHSEGYYPQFKDWADTYFYIKHRKETRGIGGVFFDKLVANDTFTLEQRFDFVKDVGNSFLTAYLPIVNENKLLPYVEAQQQWQMIRRGRYVEFNLVYDRGTHFGLQTDGRIESILMSLPTTAGWHYNHEPASGSPEEKSLRFFQTKMDWVREN